MENLELFKHLIINYFFLIFRIQKLKSQKVLDVQDLNQNWRMLTTQIPILISRKSLSRLQQPKRLQKLDLPQKWRKMALWAKNLSLLVVIQTAIQEKKMIQIQTKNPQQNPQHQPKSQTAGTRSALGNSSNIYFIILS